MKPEILKWVAPIIMMLVAVAAWAAVVVVALQVSTIVLDTLHQIVELAGMG